MDLFEAIDTRRSIRKFNDKEVTEEDVMTVLKAAMQAPSARNEQPWQFIVVRDPAMRETVSKSSPYTGMAAKAPVVIVVCGDARDEKSREYWPQDCSAAIENLLLAARGKNLGAVWCGIYPIQERVDYLKKVFTLPENVIPFALVCMGYSDQAFHYTDRFRPERVHMEKWNEGK